jgi:hypothetical protein
MERQDFAFEAFLVTAAVSLTFHGLDFGSREKAVHA